MRVLKVVMVLIYAFLFAPAVVIIGTSFTRTGYIIFPPRGLTLKWFVKLWEMKNFHYAFFFSVEIALITTILSVVIGLLISFALVRFQFRSKAFLQLLFLSPVVTPPLLIGFALLHLVVVVLHQSPSSFFFVIGHLLVTLPFSIVIISEALRRVDKNLEDAAKTLGSTQLDVLWFITLPSIKFGIIAAGAISSLLSFNQVPISLMLARIDLHTFPTEIFNYIRYASDPSLTAISTLFIFLNLILIAIGGFSIRKIPWQQ